MQKCHRKHHEIRKHHGIRNIDRLSLLYLNLYFLISFHHYFMIIFDNLFLITSLHGLIARVLVPGAGLFAGRSTGSRTIRGSQYREPDYSRVAVPGAGLFAGLSIGSRTIRGS